MFEAMAMGLPLLLAVPVGEATRLAEAEGAGCAVAPGDPRALRDAVLRLRDDRPLRDRLAAAALAAAPRHSRASQAERMLEVLRAVVDGDGVDPASRVPSLSPPRMSA
jgi:glycosyltransferase involved in cell wall biosynthesis